MVIPKGVLETSPAQAGIDYAQVIAGNVATADGAKALIGRGRPTRIKVGNRAGLDLHDAHCRGASACLSSRRSWTRPEARKRVHSGIAERRDQKYSGDLAKAMRRGRLRHDRTAAGRHRRKAPGEVSCSQGRFVSRAIAPGQKWAVGRHGRSGSADRYFQQDVKDMLELVPKASKAKCLQGPGGHRRSPDCRGLRAAMG